MAIVTTKRPVPIIEGGDGAGGTYSTEEGAKLTEKPKPDPSIKVRQPLLSEILDKVHRAKNKADKIAILKEDQCEALQQICQWAFNPTITSALPPGKPPYIENDAPEGTEHTLLRTEGNGLWHFVKVNGKLADPNIQRTVMERMFIRLLEGLHKDEAELLCMVKDKKLAYKEYKNKKGKVERTEGIKGLSVPILQEAFDWDDDFKKKDV